MGLLGPMDLGDLFFFRVVAIPEAAAPGLRHSFAQAALGEKSPFQRLDLAVQQIVGLMNQADHDVRHDIGWSCFDKFSKRFVGHLRRIA